MKTAKQMSDFQEKFKKDKELLRSLLQEIEEAIRADPSIEEYGKNINSSIEQYGKNIHSYAYASVVRDLKDLGYSVEFFNNMRIIIRWKK